MASRSFSTDELLTYCCTGTAQTLSAVSFQVNVSMKVLPAGTRNQLKGMPKLVMQVLLCVILLSLQLVMHILP